MAASERTPHYSLSQFGPNDRPSWIDDYNADMRIIDTAISDGNQAVTDMTTEITDIKNRLDASNTVFNYLKWSGNTSLHIQTTNPSDAIVIGNQSQGGLGDNDTISLMNERAIQINNDGVYIIWSTVHVGRFADGLTSPVTLSLAYFMASGESGPEEGLIHGNFINPLTSESSSPTMQIEQTLSLPPTVVSLRSGAIISIMPQIYNATQGSNETTVTEVRQIESSTGIVKIR